MSAQTMAALDKANATKRQARQIRTGLESAELSLADVLRHPGLQRYRLRKVLLWLPRMGPVNAHKLLSQADMLPWRIEVPLGRLTERERRELDAAEQRRREAMSQRRAERR